MTGRRPWQGAVQLGVYVVGDAVPQTRRLGTLAWLFLLVDVIHLHRLDYVLCACTRHNARHHVDQVLPVHHQLTEGKVVGVVQVYVPLVDVLGRQSNCQLLELRKVCSLIYYRHGIINFTMLSKPGMDGPGGL